eukprot:PITA_24752
MATIGSRLDLLLCLLLLHSVLCSSDTSLLKDCSNRCESKFCREAPILRYGRYCGVFYTGCHGEAPCDGLDSCCKNHDYCITRTRNYLNVQCNQKLLDCLSAYVSSGQPQFAGATCRSKTVVNTIDYAIKAGVWIGRGIPPQDLQNSSVSTDFHGP